MGLAQGASLRIAGERTRIAMPEVGIGLFPDVGASFFLSRLPGALGPYLALTGALLRPVVLIDAACDDAQLARALDLHDAARAQCFIANSVDFPVEHEPAVSRAVA